MRFIVGRLSSLLILLLGNPAAVFHKDLSTLTKGHEIRSNNNNNRGGGVLKTQSVGDQIIAYKSYYSEEEEEEAEPFELKSSAVKGQVANVNPAGKGQQNGPAKPLNGNYESAEEAGVDQAPSGRGGKNVPGSNGKASKSAQIPIKQGKHSVQGKAKGKAGKSKGKGKHAVKFAKQPSPKNLSLIHI